MKLLRTIRLDPSDTFIYPLAAEPGEWAVSGVFVFWADDPRTLEGKARSAFRGGGFLGITSLGWSTLVQIVEANETDREGVVSMLAQRLIESFGAPEPATARAAAEEEVAFLQSLCDQPQDTLVAIHRVSENGSIRGPFRTLRPRDRSQPLRAFTFLDVEEEEPHHALDDISLAALAGKESR